MKREMIPSREELERHQKLVPEINPSAVIAMLGIRTAAEEIQQSIMSVLQKRYNLSEGKFCALIVLHQHGAAGVAPSGLAAKIGVTRATISNMLQRLEREGLVELRPAAQDGRGKIAALTAAGERYMEEILPTHYLRITRLMERLDEGEQRELIRLLRKLNDM